MVVVKLLILGGTRFLGRHLVTAARARGHEVTLFNRGQSGHAPEGVESLTGDRDGGLEAIAGAGIGAVTAAPHKVARSCSFIESSGWSVRRYAAFAVVAFFNNNNSITTGVFARMLCGKCGAI